MTRQIVEVAYKMQRMMIIKDGWTISEDAAHMEYYWPVITRRERKRRRTQAWLDTRRPRRRGIPAAWSNSYEGDISEAILRVRYATPQPTATE
jgi:hypothetical protein